MKIFVFEFICGGGLFGQPAASELMPLGGSMLSAIIEDFSALDVSVITTLDERVSIKFPANVEVNRVTDSRPFDAAFNDALHRADAALIIAPEFHRLLETLSRRVLDAGKKLLGSDPAAVAMCSDKLSLSKRLRRACIATPLTLAGLPSAEDFDDLAPMVIKPRFGAGCEDTFVVQHADDLRLLPKRDDWIAQPRVPGTAASAAFIVNQTGHVQPLRAGLQKVASGAESTRGVHRLAYSGGKLPLPIHAESRLLALAENAIFGVKGLRGFVGVDLLLGDHGGSKDCVIEINPRLTVAYVGLRALSQNNLAAWLLDAAGLTGAWSRAGEAPVWRDGQIDYSGSGSVKWSPTPAPTRARSAGSLA